MAGINNGHPEATIGEPIRFGDIDGFELEHHPISDRLLIRDTVNGKVAYIRREQGGEIGGDGVLIKALKESKPMNDIGRVYDTIQQAEREASSWVFVPPGTYNETIDINTEGLTLQGCGRNTVIDSGVIDDRTVHCFEEHVTVRDMTIRNDGGRGTASNTVDFRAGYGTVQNLHVPDTDRFGIILLGGNNTVVNCTVSGDGFNSGIRASQDSIISGCIVENIADGRGINGSDRIIISNNIVNSTSGVGISENDSTDAIIVGNRVINSQSSGISIAGDNAIIANNRVSDSGNSDINDSGTNTLLAGNLTGASN